MIITGTRLLTQQVLQVDNFLVHSSKDLTLCCTSDLISCDLNVVIREAVEIWKQGKTTNLIMTPHDYLNYLDYLQSCLKFPVLCKLTESNLYNRIIKVNEFMAESFEQIKFELVSQESFKVLAIGSCDKTFVTANKVSLNILVFNPRISTKIEKLPLEKGNLFILTCVTEENLVQVLTFIGRANKSLNVEAGPNKLYQVLMRYKDRLGRLSQIIEQQSLSFNQILEHNHMLQQLNQSI